MSRRDVLRSIGTIGLGVVGLTAGVSGDNHRGPGDCEEMRIPVETVTGSIPKGWL